MAYPDLLLAADHEAIRSLLGVTEADVADEIIDQPPYGQLAEASVKSRIDTWSTDKADPTKGLLLRMAAAYAAAAYLAETYAQGGMLGLLHWSGAGARDWTKLAEALWARSLETTAGMLEVTEPTEQLYSLPGMAIGGPSRTYYRPLYGRDWWKYPPVVAFSGAPFDRLPEE